MLNDALEEVVTGFAAATNLADACAELADFGVRHLRADAAGVARRGRRGLEFLAATDPVLADLGAAREAASDAPPTAPLEPGETLLMAESGTVPTAPAWLTLAHAHGFGTALLIGLPALSAGTATLELYYRDRLAFPPWPLRSAAQAVRLAGLALREAERRLNLEEALHTRGLIGQAQGVLMERYALTDAQAMAFLRRQSQHTHRPIRELATGVVERREIDAPPVPAPRSGPEDSDTTR